MKIYQRKGMEDHARKSNDLSGLQVSWFGTALFSKEETYFGLSKMLGQGFMQVNHHSVTNKSQNSIA